MKMPMPPQPPHPQKRMPEPPQPQKAVIVSTLDDFDLEAEIWIYGGYPQVPHALARFNILQLCRRTPFGHICAEAILYLDEHRDFTQSPISQTKTKSESERITNDTKPA